MTQLFPSASELAEHARLEPTFAAWQRGYGPLQHSPQTCAAVYRMAHQLVQAGVQADLPSVYRHFHALDRLTAAGLWLDVETAGADNMVSSAKWVLLESLFAHFRCWVTLSSKFKSCPLF